MRTVRSDDPRTSPLTLLLRSAVLAAAVIGVLQLLHAHVAERHPIPPLLHWGRDAALALPLAAVAVLVGERVARRSGAGAHGALAAALAGGAAFALLSVPGGMAHERLFVAEHSHSSGFLSHSAADGMSAWLLASATLLVLAGLAGLSRRRRAVSARRPLVATLAASLVAPLGMVGLTVATATPASAAGPACDNSRNYDVAVIDLEIPYHRWGNGTDPEGQPYTNLDRDGMMYVLQQDKPAVKNWHLPLTRNAAGELDPANDPAGNRRLRPRPLVLRANAGDCVRVTLKNELTGPQLGGQLTDPRVGMHISGVQYDLQTSDGSKVGFNEDTTVGVGQTRTFVFKAPERDGVFLFRDNGAMAGGEADGGSVAHGLFGALAVEPSGSQWYDPVSGKRLDTATPYSEVADQSGELYLDAMIKPLSGVSFRESVQLAHDEIPGIGFGFNYGAEPAGPREAQGCGDCVGEETSLSSWTFGDPALVKLASGKGPWLPTAGAATVEDCGLPSSCWTSNVTHAYPKDPTKIRYGLAGVKETHVFHMHAHQWKVEQHDAQSTVVDSQTFGPGDMFTADLIGGAGSLPGTVGDSIFHCHLYPHFAEGFWSLFRVHDVTENGTGTTPDGIGVRELKPLPGRAAEPTPTDANPGFPRFIPGQVGWRAPQPPKTVWESNGGADTPATPAREDLVEAPRIVAGRFLDPADPAVARETAVLQAAHSRKGTTQRPGAPMTDPCPTGARKVTYNVSVVQRDMVYNEDGWHDTQARLYVLDKDLDAVLSGAKEPEPLFIRVNAGDCIDFNLTNYTPNWAGGDAFIELAQTNMLGGHIHLVKFDVLGSDGASNGWNYQQAAFTKEQVDFNAQIAANPASCTAQNCRIATPGEGYLPGDSTAADRGQTIRETWYADSELRTVFTHDHHFPALVQNRGQYGALLVEPAGMDVRNPRTGEFYQPLNRARGSLPACGDACVGTADGAMRDIIGEGASDDFREFGLSIQDFVSLTRKGGNPTLRADTFNPPEHPEHYPNEDPGVMGINYKNAPFLIRDTKNGQPVDPAYRFSSTVFGDPKTPLLQAYAGDRVQVRLIQGSQEEQHVFALHGMRWREEPDDPNSPLVNAKALGVSDAPNFVIPPMPCSATEDCQGDFLYSSTSTDATYLGAWGLMRVYGKGNSALLPLPDNTPQAANGNVGFKKDPEAMTARPIQEGMRGGAVCPSGTPVKKYDVFATDGTITYNAEGDHDPFGLMYGVVAPGETPEDAVTRVRREQKPMVLRANEGDCLEVTLTNRIDPDGAFASKHAAQGSASTVNGGDPELPLEPSAGTPAGLRVSLHPALVRYDVRYSDGAAAGFNRDQTVGPGQSILYRWFADDVSPGELGATNLVDFGDVRGHRHHGLFAGLVVEPKGATYHDPISGAPVASGEQADIRIAGAADFREHVPFFQDGLNLRNKAGARIAAPAGVGPLDAEDEGEKGFNYRSPRFVHRGVPESGPLSGPAVAHVFDSTAHGDPDTPIFRSYAGDAVRVRLLQGSDKPRQHAYSLSGHGWRSQAHDTGSNLVGTSGGFSVSRSLDVHLPSAGGDHRQPGDYRYSCAVAFHHLSGGLWGISRVYAKPTGGEVSALGQGKLATTGDNPRREGYFPIQPLEQRSVTAAVFEDVNGDRVRGADELPLIGVPVTAHRATTGAAVGTTPTDASGRATFSVAAGEYDLVVTPQAGLTATTPTKMRVTATEGEVDQTAQFGQVRLGKLAVRPFNDKNGDGTKGGDSEPAMETWPVTLTGGGRTLTAAVTGGVAAFDDLMPGDYTVSVTPAAGYHLTSHMKMPVEIAVGGGADSTLAVGYALKAGAALQVFNDSNDNGLQDTGESSLAGRKIDVRRKLTGELLTSVVTDAAGNALVDDPSATVDGLVPDTYELVQALEPDWKLSRASRKVTSADGAVAPEEALTVTPGNSSASVRTAVEEKTSQVVTLRNHNPKGWVVAVPFNDLNRDGVRQDREGRLIGWSATLMSGTTVLGETTTGSGGEARFYVDRAGPVGTPVPYTVKMAPKEVAATEVEWTATTPAQVTVGAVSGEDRSGSFGFVQLGTIQAEVFADVDKDGVYGGGAHGPLANRTARLLDSSGKTVLQQKPTDEEGRAAFKASVGVEYQLEVLLPTGWVATTPLAANGSATTRIKVPGPTGTESVKREFGQYNTTDVIPPPAPTVSAVPGTRGEVTLTLASEAGATFRYTLDGDLPSGNAGMTYTGPITVSTKKTLTAVALDAAGNVSPVTTATYLTREPNAVVIPSAWVRTTGTTRGELESLRVRNEGPPALRYFLVSALSGKTHVVDGYGSATLTSTQRNPKALGLRYEGRASIDGVTRTLELWDWSAKRWVAVRPGEAERTVDGAVVHDAAGDPARFASGGEVRFRVRASATKSFEIGMDQMTLSFVH